MIDNGLDEALREFNPELLRRRGEIFRVAVIGSASLLLAAFERMADFWSAQGADAWNSAVLALESVAGRFDDAQEAAIARAELLISFANRTGLRDVEQLRRLPVQIGVGSKVSSHAHVVLACATDAAFELGAPDAYVAVVVPKRAFVLPGRDIIGIVDLAGAYVPGRSSPTLLLFGRCRPPVSTKVWTARTLVAEPIHPAVPERGSVWKAIPPVGAPDGVNEFVEVVTRDRESLSQHPWGDVAKPIQQLGATRAVA